MGKNNVAAAQRAKKKHQKEQKRKKASDRKRQGIPPHPGTLLPHESPPQWNPGLEGIEGIATRLKVSFYEAAYTASFAVESLAESQRPDRFWTRGKVIALETSELVARLEGLGVKTDRDSFIAATPRFGSAVQHAKEAWFPLAPAPVDAPAHDFLALAACELWKRWRPEAPSQEMLVDLVRMADDCADQGDDLAATEHGIRFWTLLQPLLGPEMRRTEDAEELLGGWRGLVFNWAGDFSMVAMPVASRDAALGRRAAEVQAAVIAQFSAEGDSWRLPLLLDHAEMLYGLGERAEAERILHGQIDQHPGSAGAYVRLSRLWAPYDCKDRESIARALALLEEAAARPVKDAADWDLSLCIREQREKLRGVGQEAPRGTSA
jgi:hypothetical protein